MLTFMSSIHGLQFIAYLGGIEVDDPRGRSGDKQVVAHAELSGITSKLSHTKAGIVFHSPTDIHFADSGIASIVFVPFAQALT